MLELSPENPRSSATNHGQRAESAEDANARPRTYGILVVDDEPGVRGVLKVAMRQQGFAVWLAANGREALDIYWLHQHTIDVVLMDVRMPGLDGPQTLTELKNLNPQIRCCFMSGDLGAYTEERLFNLGAVAIIPKPFHLDEISQVLQNALFHDRKAACANQRRETLPQGIEA